MYGIAGKENCSSRDGHKIGDSMRRVCIIAEAGVNHNGSMENAKKMVDVAKKAGADYVKFQTFIPQNLVSKYAEKAEYQKKSTGTNESQLTMLERLSLSYSDFEELKRYSDSVGIGFLSTPFDMESIDFLNELNMDFWKIPSGEITNLPYLEKIAKTGKRVVLSTGMSTLQEIKGAINVLEKNGARCIELLHCNTQYPTPYDDVNLRAMNNIRDNLHKRVGYSDHTMGIEVPIAAVAMGAEIIEKHFTLDRNMEGPDHKASLEPKELFAMVSAIRNIERAFGEKEKKISDSEKKNIAVVRKSIVASCKIEKGEEFCVDNITTKRPGNGISPMRWYEILGKKATRSYEEDEMIEL